MGSSLWNRSGIVERYADDIRASGAKAYFYLGGTTTPLTVYRDSATASAHPTPLLADADGRWPDVFIPYITSYDVRVTGSDDVQLTFTQNIPNPDPVDLSVTVPPDQVVQTGMVIFEMVNTTRSGYVRLNGRTIGNAASGASERANADTSALFAYLWAGLDNTVCPVSGGRGASAAADFAANKNIGLPDMRGSTPVGLDDMGNSAASAFASLTFTYGSGTLAGSIVGINGTTISIAQMPAHTHTGTSSIDGTHLHTVSGSTNTGTESANHTHTVTGTTDNNNVDHTHSISPAGLVASGNAGTLGASNNLGTAALTNTGGASNPHTHTFTAAVGNQSATHIHSVSFTSAVVSSDGAHSHTFTTDSKGSGAIFNNLQLSRLGTWFIKL